MNSKRLKILVMLLVALALCSILLAACSRPGTITTTITTGNTPTTSAGGGGGGAGCASGTVHMGASSFLQSCVNISKGSKVTLIDDVQSLHIITNGMWVGSNPNLSVQPGAPTIPNVTVASGSGDIGPFNTAGKFNVLCTVHVGMNLVVNVT